MDSLEQRLERIRRRVRAIVLFGVGSVVIVAGAFASTWIKTELLDANNAALRKSVRSPAAASRARIFRDSIPQ